MADQDDWKNWQPTVSSNPWLMSGTLEPLSDLIRDPEVRSNMEKAVQQNIMDVYLEQLSVQYENAKDKFNEMDDEFESFHMWETQKDYFQETYDQMLIDIRHGDRPFSTDDVAALGDFLQAELAILRELDIGEYIIPFILGLFSSIMFSLEPVFRLYFAALCRTVLVYFTFHQPS